MDNRDRAIAIATAITELEEAVVKSDDEVMQVIEHRWEILQEPMTMTVLQQVIKDAKSVGLKTEHMRIQRFLQNVKRHNVPWALAELHRISSAEAQATYDLFGATPDTIHQVLITHEALLQDDYWIYCARARDRLSSEQEESTQHEIVRKMWKERRHMAIQCLEDAYNKNINYAEKQFRKNFEAWLRQFPEEFRRQRGF